MQKYVETNGIKLAYLDHPGPENAETLIMTHGLTANAHCFDGLIDAGLNEHYRVISIDLRGRGLSDKPSSGYSMDDHAKDILGLMDSLGLESAVIGGHSFGGLVTIFMGAHYPDRVKKMIIIDSGLMHPDVRDLIKPSLDRLGKPVESWEKYRDAMRMLPYFHDGFWDENLDAYYRADVEDLPDGTVKPRPTAEAIAEAVDGALGADWPTLMPKAAQPAILINAPAPFGPGNTGAVIRQEDAEKTVSYLPNCTYQAVPGNHLTMLFGDYAPNIVNAIVDFVKA